VALKLGVTIENWQLDETDSTEYRVVFYEPTGESTLRVTFDNYMLRVGRTEAPLAKYQRFERELRNGTVVGEKRWARLQPHLLDSLNIRL
jgi:hypothetical protein